MSEYMDWAEKAIKGEVPAPPVAQLVGFEMTDIGQGRSTFKMEAREEHANPMGTLHGGILCDLTDAAMGSAYGSLLEQGESFTTLELSINFLRPFWTGPLACEAEVVQKGKRVGMTEAVVYDEKGRIIAKATSTCMTLTGEQAKGR